MAWSGILIAMALAAPASLLVNPGFEQVGKEGPVAWQAFLLPQPGAVARLSEGAHGGRNAAMIHVPVPYPQEPLNNWSQNISLPLGGKRIRVRAFVKTENATEAAVWVQCWRNSPWGLLSNTSSETDQPIRGTQDWRSVEMNCTVPAETSFVTVRCLLKGTGTAWFDDVTAEEAIEEPAPAAPPVAATSAPAVPPAAPATPQEEIERLKQANLLLAETVEQLQAEHASLKQEVAQLRRELEALRAAGTTVAAPGPVSP